MLKIFEQKNNTLAFILIAIAAILWGGFGLISVLVQATHTPPLLFVTLGVLFSLLSATLAGLFSKNNNIDILKIIFTPYPLPLPLPPPNNDKNHSALEKANISEFRKTTILRSFAGLGPVLGLAGFYLLDNKIMGVLISETYPVFAILISYILFKNGLKKSNLAYDWLLIGLSIFGLVVLFAKEIYLLESNTGQFLGASLSLIGALMVSYSVVLSPKMTIQLSKIKNKGNLRNSLSGLFVTNLIMFSVLFVLSIIFYTFDDFKKLLDLNVLFYGFLYGCIIFLSNLLSRACGAIATTHNIFLVWLLTPIIGVLLLWYFGYGEINTTIILAFILILAPNILLNLDLEESFSFKATFIWILLSTIILFYTRGNPIAAPAYFASTTALLAVFALTVTYLTFRSDFTTTNIQQHPDVLAATKSKLSPLKPVQAQPLRNSTKLLALLLISTPLTAFIIVFRDNTFLHDTFALLTTTAVAYALAHASDKLFIPPAKNNKNNKLKQHKYPSLAGMTLLTLLIIAFVSLFFAKHSFTL